MRNLPLWNFPAFRAATLYLRDCGYRIVSPHELDEHIGFTEDTPTLPDGFVHAAMRRDIEALLTVEGVALLPGWETSEGAKFEVTVAQQLGLLTYVYDADAADGCRLAAISPAGVARRVAIAEGRLVGFTPAQWDVVAKMGADAEPVKVDRPFVKGFDVAPTVVDGGDYAILGGPLPTRSTGFLSTGTTPPTVTVKAYLDLTPGGLSEVDELLAEFTAILKGPTGDGKAKRDRGTKPLWKDDPSHAGAALRHLGRWHDGETEDADSGCHPLAHAAWRLLAVAWQESTGTMTYDMVGHRAEVTV